MSFSYTLKSRQVSPATGFPLESFTLTGTSTYVVSHPDCRIRCLLASCSPVQWSGHPWCWAEAGWMGPALAHPPTYLRWLGVVGRAPDAWSNRAETPERRGACGAGASGTACCSAGVCWGCVWANAAGLRLNDELRIAVSASAFRPRSTGILSSRYDTAPAGFLARRCTAFQRNDEKGCTRQSIRRAAASQVCPELRGKS